MSAPGQAPETTEAPSAPEVTEQTQQTTTQPGSDGLDRLYSRMDEVASQQARMAETLTQFMTPAEEEADESEFYTDEGELTEEGARAVISDLVRESIQAELAPREKARALEQRDDAFEALKDEYPELQDEKVAEQALGAAIRWAQQNDPAIIESPGFVDVIELAYKSAKFDELAKQQTADQPRIVLESAQGARQQHQPQGPDWSDRIVKAAERLRPQI
jgi:polyhydroxyalkanoate synthesis regulator phasin